MNPDLSKLNSMIMKIQYNNFFKGLIMGGLLIWSGPGASGQGTNEEVTIIAPYLPAVGNAFKMPFRPEISQPEQAPPVFEYEYLASPPEIRMDPDPIEPLNYSENKDEQVNRNFLKAGFGNYLTPYIDFMAGSLPSEKYQFGARLKHLSSQGKIKGYPPSAYSQNLVSASGKVFFSDHTLAGETGYERDVVHFYGFMPDSFPEFEFSKDDLKQRFQHVNGRLEFRSNYKEEYKLNHMFSLEAHYFSDHYGTRESEASFAANFDKSFKTGSSKFEHAFLLGLGLDYLNYQDSLSSSDPLFLLIRPVYRFGSGPYRFEAGFNINLASLGSTEGSTLGIDVFPVVKADLVIIPGKLKAFAELSGSRTINSFRSLAGINPYIISTPSVKYTDEQFRIGGGISGNTAGINFLAEASYSYMKDMPLFVNDTAVAPENRFEVIYDDFSLLKIKGGMNYLRGDIFYARFTAAMFHYIPDNESKAWHLPGFELSLDAGYTFKEKYTMKASALISGSKYARSYDNGLVVPVKLDAAYDLGLGFEYRVNEMITAYIEANNILNQHYQLWYRYPVQGILVMAGAKLSF